MLAELPPKGINQLRPSSQKLFQRHWKDLEASKQAWDNTKVSRTFNNRHGQNLASLVDMQVIFLQGLSY